MAILVGVMAPQLIKYIEKSNVSSDTQLCDSIRTAMTTAMMDPSVINDASYKDPADGECGGAITGAGSAFENAVFETLGVTKWDQVESQLKSSGAKGSSKKINVKVVNANSIIVYIEGTDNTGLKGKNQVPTTVTSSSSSWIYAGPADLYTTN